MSIKTWSWLAGLGITALWASSFFLIRTHWHELPSRGLIGDSFGAVNALFSGLAFAGLIVTLIYQSRIMETDRQAAGFKMAFDVLQDPAVAKARELVINARPDVAATFEDSFLDEAHEVCKSFNTVGALCRAGYVNLGAVAAVWGWSVMTCWPKLESIVRATRVMRGDVPEGRVVKPYQGDELFAKDFEWLAREVKAIRDKGMTNE